MKISTVDALHSLFLLALVGPVTITAQGIRGSHQTSNELEPEWQQRTLGQKMGYHKCMANQWKCAKECGPGLKKLLTCPKKKELDMVRMCLDDATACMEDDVLSWQYLCPEWVHLGEALRKKKLEAMATCEIPEPTWNFVFSVLDPSWSRNATDCLNKKLRVESLKLEFDPQRVCVEYEYDTDGKASCKKYYAASDLYPANWWVGDSVIDRQIAEASEELLPSHTIDVPFRHNSDLFYLQPIGRSESIRINLFKKYNDFRDKSGEEFMNLFNIKDCKLVCVSSVHEWIHPSISSP